MNEKARLLMALQQLNNITDLIQDNKYRDFMYSRLMSVEVELQRQLTNLTYHERRRIQVSSKEYADDAEQQRSELSDLTSTN